MTAGVLAFLDIGFGEMVVVAFVALLLFGGRLPEMMRKFGASYREFKRGLEDVAKNPLSGIRPPASSMPYKPTLPSILESKPPTGAPPAYPPMPTPVPDPAFAKGTAAVPAPPATAAGSAPAATSTPPPDDAPLV